MTVVGGRSFPDSGEYLMDRLCPMLRKMSFEDLLSPGVSYVAHLLRMSQEVGCLLRRLLNAIGSVRDKMLSLSKYLK
jgi:hypothetical protein